MRFFYRTIILIVTLAFSLWNFQNLNAQTNCACWGIYPLVHQRLVANVPVSANINGYTEVLPPGYNSTGTKKYPLIINIPGRGARGSGTVAELCAVACEGLAFKIEQDIPTGSGNYRFPTTVTLNGQTYSYIIISPQYKWGDQETAADVQAMVNYALSHYNVDPNRVYLTGLSSGANLVVNYMGTSSQEARKVAAVVSVGLCMGANGATAKNMGTNQIHYWGLVGANDAQCGTANTINQSNLINNNSPAGNPMGKFTLVNGTNADQHIIWPDVHDKDFIVDGKNMADWFIQFASIGNAPLPATLANYEVALLNKKVQTKWTTNLESNTDFFSIERAGPDMQFKQIGKVTAAGNSSNPINYSFSDPAPLKGTSFYRLVLMNKDGMPDIYEIKKITNREFGISFSVSPVPAHKSVQLTVEIEEAQKLNFSIRDINGRQLRVWSANLSSGIATIPINIEAFAAGIHYLSIQGTQFNETQKFIKQ